MFAICCAGTSTLVSVSTVFCPVKGRTYQPRESSSSSAALGVDPTKCIALKGPKVQHFFREEKPYDSFRRLQRRILFVPLGHTIIAHRFIGGIERGIGRKAPQGAKDLFSSITILQIFVVSVDNLSSLSGLNLSTGHLPTLERVGYCRASQGDEDPPPKPLMIATVCLHKNYFEPLFSRIQMFHCVA